MQLVKKKKGKKRPGYRGPGEYQGGTSGGSSKSSSSSKGGGFTGGGGGGADASTQSFDSSANPNRPGGPIGRDDSGAPGPDRSAVSQFSEYGRNKMAQNLGGPTFSQRIGGMGSSILGGILGLINPALGFITRGITSIPGVFDKFKSSNTLEEFRDKLRGYGRTMPFYSNNPAFGGIESLGSGGTFTFDDDEQDILVPMAKPNNSLMTTGVQEGPYKGMYDYLESAPINNQAGLVSTQQFKDSPFAAADFQSLASDNIDEQMAIDNEIAALRGYR